MNLLWIRPVNPEQMDEQDEQRIREFVDSPGGISESVESLADKIGISRRSCRRILDGLVEQGIVQRRDFDDMPPMYVRFPSR